MARQPRPGRGTPAAAHSYLHVVRKNGIHPYIKRLGLAADRKAAAAPWKVTDLLKAYDWPSDAPGRGVIAIVELGGGWVQSDIDQYFKSSQSTGSAHHLCLRRQHKRTAPTRAPVPNSDPRLPVALDIEVAGAASSRHRQARHHSHVLVAGHCLLPCKRPPKKTAAMSAPSRGALTKPPGAPKLPMRWSQPISHRHRLLIWLFCRIRVTTTPVTAAPLPANVDATYVLLCTLVGCGGTYKTSTVETVWNYSPGQTRWRRHRRRLLHHLPCSEFSDRNSQAARRLPLRQRPHGPRRFCRTPTPTPATNVVVHGTTTRSSAEPAPSLPSTPASSPPSVKSLASSRRSCI